MSERIWLQHYPPGVPDCINPHAYSSLIELYEYCCTKFSAHSAVSSYGVDMSYGELERNSRYFAAYLQQKLHLKKGDRFAIMLPNVMQYYVAMFAAHRAGLVVVNINPLYTESELSFQLIDSGAEAIIVLANFAKNLAKIVANTALKYVIVSELGDLLGSVKGLFINFIANHVKRKIPPYHFDSALSFKKILSEGKRLVFQRLALSSQDIAYLQYTGGTTGIPKGAVLTHGNMVANVEQAYAWVIKAGLLEEGKEIIMVPLPLYHIFSLTVCALCFSKMGAKAVLILNPRDTFSFIKELAKVPYTVLVGINTLFHQLMRSSKFSRLTFSTLKLVVAGGMPVQKEVAEQWHAMTGIPILEGYGLTEASPIVTINPIHVDKFTGSIGMPVPSTDVVVLDENGQELSVRQVGELCIKGPQLMREYWKNPDETAQAFTTQGWFKTGDLGYFDESGFFYLVDRKKDMILVSGFNVYPNEVENVLRSHPGILEAAVISVTSEQTGEAVKAFVVKKDPALTTADIIAFCREHLIAYKIPRQIQFMDDLPKSNLGKVLRRELRGL